MTNFAYKRFEKLTPLLKALWTIIITTVVFEVAQMDLPTTVEEWKARGPQLGITLALAAIRALQNTWKNRELPGNPLYNLGKYWTLLLLLPALTIGGCATLGVAGVASSAESITKETTPDGGTFEHTTRARGEVDKALFQLDYKGKPDGAWDLSIGQDSEGMTSPAMQAAIMANTVQMQAFADIVKALVPLIPAPGLPSGGGVTLPELETPEALPAALPTDLAGWITFIRQHPELVQALEGLRP